MAPKQSTKKFSIYIDMQIKEDINNKQSSKDIKQQNINTSEIQKMKDFIINQLLQYCCIKLFKFAQ